MKESAYISLDGLPSFVRGFSQTLVEKDVVCLSGALGSGKTTFTHQLLLALGLSSQEPFSSPTFSLLNQYEVEGFLVNHVDLYRLDAFSEFENIDILPLFTSSRALSLVEWGDKFPELQKEFTKWVHFEYAEDNPEMRRLTIKTR